MSVDMNVPVDVDVSVNMDVPVDTRYGLRVLVVLGDSRVAVDMDVSVVLGDSRVAVDMDVPVADMNVPVVMAVRLDMDVLLLAAADMPGVDMPEVVDIDNRLFCGGFWMPASMLNNLLPHYHYAVTLVFRWWRVPVVQRLGVPVEYPHKLSPQ